MRAQRSTVGQRERGSRSHRCIAGVAVVTAEGHGVGRRGSIESHRPHIAAVLDDSSPRVVVALKIEERDAGQVDGKLRCHVPRNSRIRRRRWNDYLFAPACIVGGRDLPGADVKSSKAEFLIAHVVITPSASQ